MRITQRKFKTRTWALRHLKRNGFNKSELLLVYKSMIRPIAEYCSYVFHTMLTESDSNELERIQMQALKGIYGWRLSYSTLLERSGIERLSVRRETRFVELADRMVNSNRFNTWFPLRLVRQEDLRDTRERYKIYPASSERYVKSPLNQMRRRLNAYIA